MTEGLITYLVSVEIDCNYLALSPFLFICASCPGVKPEYLFCAKMAAIAYLRVLETFVLISMDYFCTGEYLGDSITGLATLMFK